MPKALTPTIYCGWDIGGAHLKVAVLATDGQIVTIEQLACPLWRGLEHLELALNSALSKLPQGAALHTVTMTGELCDLFASRADGVARILEVIESRLGNGVRIYAGAATLSTTEARAQPAAVASLNWRATASCVAVACRDALVIDIGSTTTDLIPVLGHQVAAVAHADGDRLTAGELVYTGVCRTPVMAVAHHVPYAGVRRALTAEYFANMADVYRILQELPAHADLHPTADARPADRPHSLARLARMVGEDTTPANSVMLIECAAFLARRQQTEIEAAVALVLSRHASTHRFRRLIGAGVGEFLAPRVAMRLGFEYQSFAAVLDAPPAQAVAVATCAPAVALARLAWQAARNER
ncbi:MAG: S-layer protein [Gammaproteobacteria bacterium]|nr:S-layer protein [Gammaproteobacteria bacterium]